MKLPATFFEQKNVVKIARELLGKVLFTKNRWYRYRRDDR